jgi:hypothetical protein
VGLERGLLNLVSTVEELFEEKGSNSGLENREYGRKESVTLTTWHPVSAKVYTNFTYSKLQNAFVQSRTKIKI